MYTACQNAKKAISRERERERQREEGYLLEYTHNIDTRSFTVSNFKVTCKISQALLCLLEGACE